MPRFINPNIRKFKYLCDHSDSKPGDVEPCASTDTDEPSCGIAIMDTDGEWVEVKQHNSLPCGMILQRAIGGMYGRVR